MSPSVRRRGTGLASLVLLAVAASACAAKAPTRPGGTPVEAPEAPQAFAAATAHCAGLRTVTATIRLAGRVGTQRVRARLLAGFAPPASLRLQLVRSLWAPLRDYPDRAYLDLRRALAEHHGLDADQVLPGNGAAELFTWAARDAGTHGTSLLPTPGFADYRRALACWGAAWRPLPLPLHWSGVFPNPFPLPHHPPAEAATGTGEVLWITNPHNPTGQLWSRASLEPLLTRFALVIADEAFLPLVPGGEDQSLVPLLTTHPNLVVVRSLTKLFAIAGLRLGYALADPDRLWRWAGWRDPWPVNGLAAAAGERLIRDDHWPRRVRRWVANEGPWLAERLAQVPGLRPLPSAANFLLMQGERAGQPLSLEPLRLGLEHHRILVRDCRSFEGLDDTWIRLALLDRAGHRRLLSALRRNGGDWLSR